MSETRLIPGAMNPGLTVGHVAEFNRGYPGETVTLFTRVEVKARLSGFRLQIGLPPGLIAGAGRCVSGLPDLFPQIAPSGRTNYVIWNVERPAGLQPGERHEFTLEARVAPAERDLELESRALVTWRPASTDGTGETYRAEDTVTISVSANSKYLKFMPAIYQEDELMGRFLMIFESFWEPISQQIRNMHVYFDPRLTQIELLPWLASWIGLAFDDRWPEARRRRLVQSGLTLLRKRGTKRGLQQYLEIYAGRRPRIVEHGAHNFRLGPEARLGAAIALGKSNRPHTFTVYLTLPPVELREGETEADRARQEDQRRRMIVSIVESERPAHTDYVLELSVES